jgi:hypothetical protein
MKTFPRLEKSHSCVIVRDDGSVFVQSIDAYGFQREMTVSPIVNGFTVHVYQHPGRREIVKMTRAKGGKFLTRFLHLAEHYPTLLFPADGECPQLSRNHGFVLLCERIFRGECPAKVID